MTTTTSQNGHARRPPATITAAVTAEHGGAPALPAGLAAQRALLGATVEVPRAITGLGVWFNRQVPHRSVRHVNALREETQRVGREHDPDVTTHGEARVTSDHLRRAQASLRHGLAKPTATVRRMAEVEAAQQAKHTALTLRQNTLVVGYHGESITTAEAAARHAAALAVVRKDTDAGSKRHQRVSRLMRRAAIGFAVVDAVVLFLFLAAALNVNLVHPARTPVMASVAALLALVGTAGYALSMHFAGTQLRAFKNDDRWLTLPERGAKVLPLAMLTAIVVLPVLAGILMTYRIVHDADAAATPVIGGILTGAFVAILLCALGWVIGFSSFLDGSPHTATLDHHGRILRHDRNARNKIITGIDSDHATIQHLHGQLTSQITKALVRASRHTRRADRTLLIAHSYLQNIGAIANTITSPNETQTVHGHLHPSLHADLRELHTLEQRATHIDNCSTQHTAEAHACSQSTHSGNTPSTDTTGNTLDRGAA